MGDVGNFFTYAYSAVAQTFAQIKDEMRGQELTHEGKLVISTSAAFAQADLACLVFTWEDCNDGEIPETLIEDTMDGISEIRRNLRVGRQPQSASDVSTKSRGAAMAISHLVEKLEPPDQVPPDIATAVNLSQSKLDSRELLKNDVPTCLRLLFDALTHQFQCCKSNHYGRLKLTGFINQIDAKSRMFFDLYLSSRHDWKPCRWLESRCTITDSLEKRAEPACNIIKESEDRNRNLNLLLENSPNSVDRNPKDTAWRQEKHKGKFQVDHCERLQSSASPTVSLWDLLERSDPRRMNRGATKLAVPPPFVKERAALCLQLALSLLQLSGDDWSRVNWCSDEDTSIYFLLDPDTRTVLDTSNPYLSFQLQKFEIQEDKDKTLLCNPQLLDFAQVLVEIHDWKRLPADLEAKRTESKEAFRQALSQHVSNYITESSFTLAVNACLDIAGRTSQDGSTPGELQSYIWKRILLSLDANASYPNPSDFISRRPLSPSPDVGDTEEPYDWTVDYDEPEDKRSTSVPTHAEEFLKSMRRFTDDHIKTHRGASFSTDNRLDRKIRIAVIDSGARKADPRIDGWCKGSRIKECRNFSSQDPEDWDDKIGHGTMVSCLLRDVAPEAELYIAKVCDQSKIPSHKLYCIAEAINWAVQRWEVDIITMSLALADENELIDEALKNALSPSFNPASAKIVFAAAGNKGGNAQRAWPARRSGVIAIHTTDGLGVAANHNPDSEKGKVNFATLGRNIPMEWKSDPDSDLWETRFISGTSFATPIAAGIAANVLEFARHNLNLTAGQKYALFSHNGMRKVMSAMSGRNDRDYHYIQPWTLWERAEKGKYGNREDVKLIHNDPRNICKVLQFIIGEESSI